MDEKIRFVTLFERTNNEILLKDVGMIPYFLNKEDGFLTTLVTCRMESDYKYLNSYVYGLKVKFIPCFFGNEWFSGLIYLVGNSNRIDILNLYHLKIKTFIYYLIYRVLNNRGKVYLKLDIDYKAINKPDGFIKHKLYTYFLKHVDICTAESHSIVDSVRNKYRVEVNYLSNGFYNFEKERYTNKQQIFLTVGRLGTKQKATEVLLEAFAKSKDNQNWKLILVGDVQSDFREYIATYYARNPDLSDRVVFTGKVTDKEVLRDYYNQARVFVLPSRWESFGLVLLEAMSSGCYLIGTDQIPPMKDLICEGRYGLIVRGNSEVDLADAMVCASQKRLDVNFAKEVRKYANKNYRWDNIVKRLAESLRKIV